MTTSSDRDRLRTAMEAAEADWRKKLASHRDDPAYADELSQAVINRVRTETAYYRACEAIGEEPLT